ncbi:hypothetical protein ABO04_03360 [Nitrosomonas sp. HPC101]|nr:hypothetical protein [Nitrosomonas sp. HPC101]
MPDATGELVPPGLVVFDTLGWKPNPFLLTKITFKPPIIDQLAKEAGIDPAALDLLRKLGITSVDDLTSRLGITTPPEIDPVPSTMPDEEPKTAGQPSGDDMPDIPPGTPDPDGGDGATGGAGRGGQGNGGAHGGSGGGHTGGCGKSGGTNSGGQGKRSPGSAGGRPFISYLGAHPDDEESDPDGLDQAARIKIEDQAIALIISLEPGLKRTPEGNPGFDLFEVNGNGQQVQWGHHFLSIHLQPVISFRIY